jgi:hypothetical protein
MFKLSRHWIRHAQRNVTPIRSWERTVRTKAQRRLFLAKYWRPYHTNTSSSGAMVRVARSAILMSGALAISGTSCLGNARRYTYFALQRCFESRVFAKPPARWRLANHRRLLLDVGTESMYDILFTSDLMYASFPCRHGIKTLVTSISYLKHLQHRCLCECQTSNIILTNSLRA